ncbi:MAG: ABC transporter substrate-binding protein [Halolamina sp.]
MSDDERGRRRFLQTGALAATAALAGCSALPSDDGSGESDGAEVGQIGSGRSPFGDRNLTGGTPMAELPELSGELTLYSGRGEALVGTLIDYIEDQYPDFTVRPSYNSAIALVNQIETEGEESPADVFFSVNAGALGLLKEKGRTATMPEAVVGMVPSEFADPNDQWVGTSGRARTIPFNTETFEAADIPEDVMIIPEQSRFEDEFGWAPTYSSFQAFITAMIQLEGEAATREWLNGMQELGVTSYPDEFQVSQAVADGEISAGFANHYYIQRVLAGRPDAPIATAFTDGGPGAIFNVAGASVVDTAADSTLAANFVRHLLSAEAQDYFARTTFEYPLVPEIEPIGRLPTIDELNPPEGLDLTQLSNLDRTVSVLRDTGVL